jgi:hypothetical protein
LIVKDQTRKNVAPKNSSVSLMTKATFFNSKNIFTTKKGQGREPRIQEFKKLKKRNRDGPVLLLRDDDDVSLGYYIVKTVSNKLPVYMSYIRHINSTDMA